jgi:hypothetical protein
MYYEGSNLKLLITISLVDRKRLKFLKGIITMVKRKKEKDKQSSARHYTENLRLNNTNLIKTG